MFKGLKFFISEGWKYDKKYVIWVFLYQIVNSMIPVVGALMPKFVIDELMGEKRINVLVGYVLGFALYAFVSNAFSNYLFWDEFSHRINVSSGSLLNLYRNLGYADYEKLEDPAFLEMKTKARKFLFCADHGYGYLLTKAASIIGQVFTLAGLIAILSTMNIWFVVLFSVLAVLCSVIDGRATKKAMELMMKAHKVERMYSYFNNLFQEMQWAKEIRLHGLQEWLLGTYRKNDEFGNSCYKQANDCYIRSGIGRGFLAFIQQCAAYAFLIAKVLGGGMGVGSFTMCIGAVTSFGEALRQIIQSLNEIKVYDLYYDDLDEYLNMPAKLREGKKLPADEREHTFEFRNVSFRYAGSEVWALKNVNLTIERGQRLSLVGENGSGKSSFIKLLCRLYDPTEGVILMDGVDIRDFDYDQYLAQFSTVFQDFSLFDFSLRENLAFDGRASDERIMEAIRQVGIEQRVNTLPNGLDTHVGRTFDENGFEPSGGEAQKIALARALIKEAPVVILDEPTAAMDARAEYELYRNFSELTGGKTAIYISHRMSSSRFCDKVAVLENGSLTEYGTHDELMTLGGQYAELYAMQAQYYTD